MTAYLVSSGREPFVYIRTPKTGGTSIFDGVLRRGFEFRADNGFPTAWNKYDSFAVVRHPFDRFASALRDLQQGPHEFKGNAANLLDIARSNVVDSVEPELDHPKLFERTAAFYCAPQTHPVHCIDAAKTIIRFENFRRDVNRFFNMRGWPAFVPHLHSTTGRVSLPWQHYIPVELEAELYGFYRNDFRRWLYDHRA